MGFPFHIETIEAFGLMLARTSALLAFAPLLGMGTGLSGYKVAFTFLLFLPFLVIDLVIASVLISMGMFMLPPVMISTPFKILLFVLVDGWRLVCESLVTSFVI